MGIERAFLGTGLPNRLWFRHEIYAPGLNTGYAPVPLPRLGQAVLDRDPAATVGGRADPRSTRSRRRGGHQQPQSPTNAARRPVRWRAGGDREAPSSAGAGVSVGR